MNACATSYTELGIYQEPAVLYAWVTLGIYKPLYLECVMAEWQTVA